MPFLTKNSSLPCPGPPDAADARDQPARPKECRRRRERGRTCWAVSSVGKQHHRLTIRQLRASLLARSLQQALARGRIPQSARDRSVSGPLFAPRRRPACRRPDRTWEGCLRWSGRAELPPHGRWRQSSTPTPHHAGRHAGTSAGRRHSARKTAVPVCASRVRLSAVMSYSHTFTIEIDSMAVTRCARHLARHGWRSHGEGLHRGRRRSPSRLITSKCRRRCTFGTYTIFLDAAHEDVVVLLLRCQAGPASGSAAYRLQAVHIE